MVLQSPLAITFRIFHNSLFFHYLRLFDQDSLNYTPASRPWHPTCLLLCGGIFTSF